MIPIEDCINGEELDDAWDSPITKRLKELGLQKKFSLDFEQVKLIERGFVLVVVDLPHGKSVASCWGDNADFGTVLTNILTKE